jgi:hypothetical protein
MKRTTAYGLVLLLLAMLSLLASGCGGGGVFATFTGGGLPPGEADLGGQVLAQSTSTALTPAQATVPVVGAHVVLYHGSQVVEDTTTGPNGYFKFVDPDSGNYKIAVNPPAGAKLKGVDEEVVHTKGQKTFVTIILPPA